MMKKVCIYTIALLLIFLSTIGCSSQVDNVEKSNNQSQNQSEAMDNSTPQNSQKVAADPTEKFELVLKEIPGIGTVHTYKLDNILVEPNFNIEISNIMVATGASFKHPQFIRSDLPLNKEIKEYFSTYIHDQKAKDLYAVVSAESTSGLATFNRNQALAILNINEYLGDSFNYKNLPLQDSVFKTTKMTPTDLRNFLLDFSSRTNAAKFFSDHLPMYNQMVDDFIHNELNFNHVKQIQEFYGIDKSKDNYVVYPTYTNAGGQATDIVDNDGNHRYFNQMEVGLNPANELNILYHETAHNFFAAITTDGFREQLNKYAQYNNFLGANAPANPFYSRLNETVTRVATAIMLEQYHGKTMAYENLAKEIKRGWKNTDNIFFLVKNKYLPNRAQYKTFADFIPVILDYIKTASAGGNYDIGPTERIVSNKPNSK